MLQQHLLTTVKWTWSRSRFKQTFCAHTWTNSNFDNQLGWQL